MLVRNHLIASLCAFLLLAGIASGQKLGVNEIIEAHKAAVGDQAARAEIKNLILVGDASVHSITGKTPEVKGRVVIASESGKSYIGMNFSAPDYPQEAIFFNGKEVRVAAARNNNRSVLGNFLMTNERIVRESLLGGVLLQTWRPFAQGQSDAKVSLEGTKKIDGREAYVISYGMKGSGDLKIKLFIDKETYRHVRSEYSMIFSASIGLTPNESARFSETRLKVTENFGDFETVGGLTLPRSHTINYAASGQNGTTEIEWRFTYTEIGFNQELAADTFGG